MHARQLDIFYEQMHLKRDTKRSKLRYNLLQTRKETNEINYYTPMCIPHMKEKTKYDDNTNIKDVIITKTFI